MSIAEEFISELDYELPASRKVLERVPADRAAWKPHSRSSAFGHLAQLVARMPGAFEASVGRSMPSAYSIDCCRGIPSRLG